MLTCSSLVQVASLRFVCNFRWFPSLISSCLATPIVAIVQKASIRWTCLSRTYKSHSRNRYCCWPRHAINLVTTGSKPQLAQRIFEYDKNKPLRHPAAATYQVNIPLQSKIVINVPNVDQTFTSGQLHQLRVLIADALGTESSRPAGEITTTLLSLRSGLQVNQEHTMVFNKMASYLLSIH